MRSNTRIRWESPTVWGFFGINVVGFGALVCVLRGLVIVPPSVWWLAAVLFMARMFCITGGYHRYFSHESYAYCRIERWSGRFNQFVMALGGTTAVQKGPLWWAGNHRHHHQHADRRGDQHSPTLDGFWWSHCLWFLCARYDKPPVVAEPFDQYPEIRWLDRWHFLPPIVLAAFCLWWGGLAGLLIGFLASTAALYHCTFFINSLAHVWGSRAHKTPDTSRNNFVLACVTLGEGWHNNHHRDPRATRQGSRWWHIEVTYYLLWLMRELRIIHKFVEQKKLQI